MLQTLWTWTHITVMYVSEGCFIHISSNLQGKHIDGMNVIYVLFVLYSLIYSEQQASQGMDCPPILYTDIGR